NILQRPLPQARLDLGQAPTQTSVPRTDVLHQRSVPQRPQGASQLGRSPGSLRQDLPRPQNLPRPNRLVTDPLTRDAQRSQGHMNMFSSSQSAGKSFTQD